jgi:hypothetical protein
MNDVIFDTINTFISKQHQSFTAPSILYSISYFLFLFFYAYYLLAVSYPSFMPAVHPPASLLSTTASLDCRLSLFV